jgi:hypothetical protein
MQVSAEALGPKGGRKLLDNGASEIFVPCIGQIHEAVERAARIDGPTVVHTPRNRIADADETLALLADNGLDRVLLVSGNPGHGAARYGFDELIPRFKEAGLHVSVGAYPEDFFTATSARQRREQIRILADKQAAGADRVVTQAAFKPDNALRWIEALRAADVWLPVHLGVSARIPPKMLKAMMREAVKQARSAPMAWVRNKPNLDLSVRMLRSRWFDPVAFVDAIQDGRTGCGPEGVHVFSYGTDISAIVEAAHRFGPIDTDCGPAVAGPEGEAA